VRETGLIFMAPTFLFVGSLFAAIAIGLFKTLAAGGHPLPLEALPRIATRGCGADRMANSPGVRERMYGHDRRRGGE
jgi:hypothetical protein